MRAAAVQLNSTHDVDRNLEVADDLVRDAANRGADLIVLPEKWNVLGEAEQMLAEAEPIDGRSVGWAQRIALELGVDLIAGSIVERLADQQKAANTSVHVGPDGEIHASYRKIHMFDVEVDGVQHAESAHEEAGGSLVLTQLANQRRLGMSICYDLRFPALYQALSAAGSEIVAVPSAFTLATTRDHWEVLLRARAIENQCFIVAPNQIGPHPPGHRSGGRSMIVDPWGVVLATASDEETVIVAELDFGVLETTRRKMPVLQHRQPAAYKLTEAKT